MRATTAYALRDYREGLGLTQAEAASMVHVHPRTWRKWENGERAIPEAAAHLFALLVRKPYPYQD